MSQKFLPYFLKWQHELEGYGYSNFAKVLNSKNFGCPQNRERIFMVSILGDSSYHFPEPFPLDKRLKDVLEEDVDEKYYLSDKMLRYLNTRGGDKQSFVRGKGVVDGNGVATTCTANYYKMPGTATFVMESPIVGAIRSRDIKVVGDMSDSNLCHTDGLTSSVIENHNNSISIIESIKEDMEPKRTEYGKEVRREHEQDKFRYKALEPREDGVCNTITSVQKDCLVIEPFNTDTDGNCRTIKAQYYKNGMANFKRTDGLGATGVKVVANMYDNNNQGGRIYDDKGISPTIGANSGGNLQSKLLEVARLVEEIASKARGKEICANISTDGRIVTFSKDTDKSCSDMKIDNENGVSQTVISAHEPKVYGESTEYRIRKLTPREVLRLMDVDDSDIDKIFYAGISNTQIYKMGGNSIVVSCLYHIFRKMFVETGCESQQLSLF